MRSPLQWCPTHPIRLVDVGLGVLHQHFHYVTIAIPRCQEHGCPALYVNGIDINIIWARHVSVKSRFGHGNQVQRTLVAVTLVKIGKSVTVSHDLQYEKVFFGTK